MIGLVTQFIKQVLNIVPPLFQSVDRIHNNNQRQLIQYLNKVYRSGQPVDSGMLYQQKNMTMKQIYSETVVMTDLLDENTARSFSTWCGTAKLDLTLAEESRKMQKKQ
ncbi:hypothetical protein PS15m_009923 [Mucor circinelloides]